MRKKERATTGHTNFDKLCAGDIPLISDGEGMYTVPEKYRRTHLPLSEDFKLYARRWKARRSLVDYLSTLIENNTH